MLGDEGEAASDPRRSASPSLAAPLCAAPFLWAARAAPAAVFGLGLLALWQGSVVWFAVPPYFLPSPVAVASALADDPRGFAAAAALTAAMAAAAFSLAAATAMATAALFVVFPLSHRAFFPYIIALQVTPIVALAPLILIWIGYDRARTAIVILAALTAFFPALVNGYDGLRRVDPGLHDLFRLYRAGPLQMVFLLRIPSALPIALSGLRVGANLALMGAVVAEFVVGSGSARGLAWRILEAGKRLRIDDMVAALIVLAALGIVANAAFAFVERRLTARRGA